MNEKAPDKQLLWYVRSRRGEEGPFPGAGVRRSLLLGRLSTEDLVSWDRERWYPLSQVPEVLPPEMRRMLPTGDADLIIARLREDERTGIDRRKSSAGRISDQDRRQAEPEVMERHRNAKRALRQLSWRREIPVLTMAIVSLLMIAVLGYGLYLGGPEYVSDPDCSAPPVAGVDWHNCRKDNLVANIADLEGANLGNGSFRSSRMSGALLNGANIRYSDLSGSDLSHAELRAADLQGSRLHNIDLSYADLSSANLRYADLTGANLGGAMLTGAQLEHLIWPDGKECSSGTVASCLSGH